MSNRITGWANLKTWDYEAKNIYRSNLFDFYKNNFSDKIPLDKQYWTLGGRSVKANGAIVANSEYQMAINAGLILPAQFHSVEKFEDIHQDNLKGLPEVNWYQGDFYEHMQESESKGHFKPSIINYDSLSMTKKGLIYFESILNWINKLNYQDVMIIGNFIWERPKWQGLQFATIDAFIQWIEDRTCIQRLLSNGWEYKPTITLYPMKYTGEMLTIIFYKKSLGV